ncbi:hypothetical protein BC827DRAFT_666151 [Russula dissimulans]|nr:hypothetical protein BC827DRAFT_666151 [Russula dissimulans]
MGHVMSPQLDEPLLAPGRGWLWASDDTVHEVRIETVLQEGSGSHVPRQWWSAMWEEAAASLRRRYRHTACRAGMGGSCPGDRDGTGTSRHVSFSHSHRFFCPNPRLALNSANQMESNGTVSEAQVLKSGLDNI